MTAQVLEETGVVAKFCGIVTLRHNKRYIYGCSDIYIVCRMEAVDTTLKPDFTEVVWCKGAATALFVQGVRPAAGEVAGVAVAPCVWWLPPPPTTLVVGASCAALHGTEVHPRASRVAVRCVATYAVPLACRARCRTASGCPWRSSWRTPTCSP